MASSDERSSSITFLKEDAGTTSSSERPKDGPKLHKPSVDNTTTLRMLVVGSTPSANKFLAVRIFECFKRDSRYRRFDELQMYVTTDVEKLEAGPSHSFGFVVFVINSENQNDLQHLRKQLQCFDVSFFHGKTSFVAMLRRETHVSQALPIREIGNIPQAKNSPIVFTDFQVEDDVTTTATRILKTAAVGSVDVNQQSYFLE